MADLPFPKLSWLRQELRFSPVHTFTHQVNEAFVIREGNENNKRAPLVIGVVVSKPATVRIKSGSVQATVLPSEEFSRRYNNLFMTNEDRPQWQGRPVIVKLYYPTDDLSGLQRVALEGVAAGAKQQKGRSAPALADSAPGLG